MQAEKLKVIVVVLGFKFNQKIALVSRWGVKFSLKIALVSHWGVKLS